MRVLLATDGSLTSAAAARRVRSLVPDGTEWVLASVVRPKEEPMEDSTGFAGPLLTADEAEHQHAGDVVGAHGALAFTARALGPVPARQIVLEGDVAPALAEAASATGADLVVVGHAPASSVAGAFLRSVTARLIDVSPCPVLVVPVTDADVDQEGRLQETPAVGG